MKGFIDCTGLTLTQSANLLAGNGIKIFPVIKDMKKPAILTGFHAATCDPYVINGLWSKWPDSNIGVATGAVNGFFVVDVDIKNGKNGELTLLALEEKYGKLPATLVAITPSGGRHLFFKCNERAINSRAEVLPGIDIRGDGGYILVEPSIFEGNVYKFVNVNIEIADPPGWLIKLLEVKNDNGNFGEIYKGSRNDHIFKEGLKYKSQGLTEDEAKKLALFVNHEKIVPPLAAIEVHKTIESAYKYEVKPLIPEIDRLNEKHAVLNVGGKCRVLKSVINELGHRDFELSTPEDFKAFYSNQFVVVEGKSKALGSYWFSHPHRRQFEGIGFYPKGAPEGYYNLWNGFAVEPKEGDCSLFLEHVRENIANGDKVVNDYIIAWCADLIQNPDKLVGTALVLRGAMGVGKGVFANALGSLLGQHYMIANQSGQLVGRFNGHLKGKVLLLADEAFWGGDKQAEGTLKSMVTEPFMTIEEKGVNAYTIKNHLHMIFATNNNWAVPAGAQERRFFVIDVSDKHMQDRPYFSKIENQLNNGGREALLHYLQNYDLEGINLGIFPKTNALFETKLLSMSPMEKFLYHVLDKGNLKPYGLGWDDGIVAKEDLYNNYKDFLQTINIKYIATPQEFGIQLLKLFPKGTVDTNAKVSTNTDGSKRKNAYKFPSLENCRKQFSKYLQQEISWESE